MTLDKGENLPQLPRTPPPQTFGVAVLPQGPQKQHSNTMAFNFSPPPLRYIQKKRKLPWTPKKPTQPLTSNEERGVSQLLKEARDTLLQSAKLERDKKNIGYALFYLNQARSSLRLQSLREKGELENEELYTKPQDLEDKINQILHLLQDSNKAQPFLQPSLEV